jgi:SAM-dependent methyltransferase
MKSKLAYLTSVAGSALLQRVMADSGEDLALASAPWMRALASGERTALLEQRALRLKGRRKHSRALDMLFTPLGMQQMTSEPLARYKARRLPSGIRTLADLCCGVGGDSLHLPADITAIGVDVSPEALYAYRHNTSLFRVAPAVQADVTRFQARVDGVFLDPARRALASLSKERDFDVEPEPGWEAMLELVRRFHNTAIKLGPGVRLPEVLEEEELEYLGLRDECLELTVRTGSFGRAGWVRAVELPQEVALEAPECDIQGSFDRVEAPGEYFYEPVKCVIRAHLFGILAHREGLWQLDGRLAYLSGNRRVETPLLKRYRLLKILPCDETVLRKELAAEDVGILEIKKRGLDISPEAWRQKLKPKGGNSATLVFTRLEGKAAVLWVKPEVE